MTTWERITDRQDRRRTAYWSLPKQATVAEKPDGWVATIFRYEGNFIAERTKLGPYANRHEAQDAAEKWVGIDTNRYRCPACGHWCVPADGYGWICAKRGGCGNEYPTVDGEWTQ